MIKFFPRHPAPVWCLALSAFMLLLLPLRAETLRGPGGLPPGLVAAMLGRMQGKALDARGCARLGDLRGCFGKEGARFRGAGKEVELRAVAWGREGGLEKLRWKSVGKEGSREVYQAREIEAWWRAVPLGYEDGFELMRRPQGRGPVEVELEANRVGRKVGGGIRWGEVRYGKLWVTDARGRRVAAELRTEGRKIWIRIEGRGWKYPLRIDPLVWVEQAASLPTGLSSSSELGVSVALSGNGAVAIVGAPYTNSEVGAAYVYTYDSSTGTWSSPGALSAPSGAIHFGSSVSLSSDGAVALVGAPRTNSDAGAVYIYTYDSSTGTWSSPVTLSAPGGAIAFGSSVSLSSDGTVVLVGAPAFVSFNTIAAGAAYIYTYDSSTGTWSSPVVLTVPSGAADFGSSVALSGNGEVALVGAPDLNSNPGAAYIYTSSTEAWSSASSPVALTVPSGAADFGLSVALSGNGEVALVGAPDLNSNPGAAYIYTNSSTGWSSTPVPLSVPSGAVLLGWSVALSSDGTAALVGAPNVDVSYVYNYDSGTGTWGAPVTLSAPSGAIVFGSSVSLSSGGTVALIGALVTNNYQGAAYFYGAADLDLALAVPSAAAPGGQDTEQAILTNDSNYASPDATLNLPIPVGTDYQDSSVTSPTQGSCTTSPSSGVVSSLSCDVGPLAANGGSTTAIVTLGVPSNATAGTEITETALVNNTSPSLSAQSTTVVVIAPTLSGLTNETVTVGKTVPPESFTITGSGALTVTASSSNTALLPDSGITVSPGCETSGANCMLTLVPVSGQVGTTAVTVAVTDEYGQTTSASFALTVSPPGVPTVSGLTDETVTVGETVPSESFTIAGTGALTVSASSSNTALLPDSGIGGYSGCTAAGSCTLTLTPVSGQVGTTTVTVTVQDVYGQETSASFSLAVQSSAPVVSGLKDASMTVGGPVVVEDFTVSGMGPLSVETQTTNAALLPEASINVSSGCGSGSGEVVDHCTLTLSPTAGMTGEAGVSVTVTDAEGRTATDLMTLDVEPSSGRTSEGGGGGSVGVGMLLGLLVLVGFRKRKLRRGSI